MNKMTKNPSVKKPRRDNNYYFGLLLMIVSILSLIVYLIIDAFVPLSFLITFLICGWGFVLIWKSDNDFRFEQAQIKIAELEDEITYLKMFTTPSHLLNRRKKRAFKSEVSKN